MSKQIERIAVFADTTTNVDTGRQYVSHASIQFWVWREMARNIGLSAVVTTEQDLWEHVERSVQEMIDEGYEVDEPEVYVYRTNKTCLKLDYFDVIGRHI